MKLREALKDKLTKEELEKVPSAYDIVGDIAIFAEIPEELKAKERIIGEALMQTHPSIKVVLKKTKKYSGTYRLPKTKIIAGERRKKTEHKENNVRLRLHVENVYFSTRSSNERLRIASQIQPGENVLVMFSGCGPFVIVIAKNTKAANITGIEINPEAHRYAEENAKLNKVTDRVTLINGDVNEVIPSLNRQFDRVLMPLPKTSEDFLAIALKALRPGGILHFYDFEAEEQFELTKEKVRSAAQKAGRQCDIIAATKCGQYSPRVFRVCIDAKID